ncbi:MULTISPECIES: response regulator [Niastella]|uniref:Response regulator n=1 Tax=Niastella soli TaxID=2821487 RepID=A0ABS3Z5D0_9BACT|nr:response regulator [Niastella soli]MBO9204942.1 response regulator [Niastella soli]
MKGGIQHICLAEDDPDDYLFFSETLKEINSAIKLTWFQTCEELLTFLKTGSELPCLIVLDMNMPKMDGQTCLVSIKKELELSHIPVIILSTAGHLTTINTAYQAGAFKYYHKPGSIDEFRKIITEILTTPIQ